MKKTKNKLYITVALYAILILLEVGCSKDMLKGGSNQTHSGDGGGTSTIKKDSVYIIKQ